MKHLLSLISLAVVAVSARLNPELDTHWELFKATHHKQYDSQLESFRRLIWESNVKYIQQHNLEYDMGRHTYTLGINQFADMTNAEFRAQFLGLKRMNHSDHGVYTKPLRKDALPDSVDWRTKGYVTPVKDQGQCGSWWAFSAIGSLEGQYFRKYKQLKSFSEQQLIDCSQSFGNMGCDGGRIGYAFDYIYINGIELESDYKYTARRGSCQFNASKVVTKIFGYERIEPNEDILQGVVASFGPISVYIDASNLSFLLYKDGIYNEPECSSSQLNHGMVVVGYGTDNGEAYWLVKNSYGESWGQAGYIKMSRNRNNQCGIASEPLYPLFW